jgi:hypothetical protein
VEYLLDIYARSPRALSDADRRRVLEFLEANPHYREYLDHLEDFYRSFRELRAEDVPDHVREFADRLVRLPRSFRLRPPKRGGGARNGSGSRTHFLHADAAPASASFRAAGSLVAGEHGVLLRFIEDREDGELRGYLLCPNQGEASTALVRFENLSEPVVADPAGIIRIPLDEIESVDHLIGAGVDVLLPVRRIPVDVTRLPANGATRVVDTAPLGLRVVHEHDHLRLVFDDPTGIDYLVAASERGHEIHLVTDRMIRIELDGTDGVVDLRIYA